MRSRCEYSGRYPYEDENCKVSGMVSRCKERLKRIREENQ